VGLPPEQADQIFRAFFTTKDKWDGAWGCPSVGQSLSPMAAACGSAGAPGVRAATFQFTLPITVAAQHNLLNCFRVAAKPLFSVWAIPHCVGTRQSAPFGPQPVLV